MEKIKETSNLSPPDPRIEAFMRQVDARLARGNARLQLGLVVTPEEVADRREEVLRIRF